MPARTAGDIARRELPTCSLDERFADVQKRVRAAGWDTCMVVNEERVVLGRFGRRALAADADVSAREAMSPGPSTVRPSIGTDALLKGMDERRLTSYVVTTPDGRLVGLARREDCE